MITVLRKVLVMTAAMVLMSAGSTAMAENKVKSISNEGNKTTIVVVDEDAGNSCSMKDCWLLSNNKQYKAKEVRCQLNNGTATHTLVFPFIKVFKDCVVKMDVNGKTVSLKVPFMQSHEGRHASSSPKSKSDSSSFTLPVDPMEGF